MKGKLKVIIITLLVLLVGTGALLWKLNGISQEITAEAEANLKEERDLLEEQSGKAIDEVKSVDIIPLTMQGDGKNVVTTDFDSVQQIYSAAKSAAVEETLTDIKRNKTCTLEDALWAYDPYGTNGSSMYVYFKTRGNCYCRYTISVKDEKIPDFTRTALLNTSGNVAKEHEYQLIGLVAGRTNYITMRLYNSKDELSETRVFSVDIPKSRTGAPVFLDVEDGRSKTAISNGLYVVFQDGRKGSGGRKKSKRYGILLYDNSGVLRAEIPTDGYAGRSFEKVYDTLLFAVSDTQVSEVNALGQVIRTYSLKGYRQSGEFVYDGYGNLFLIANRIQKKEIPGSEVIKLELENGAVTEMVDMQELLPAVYRDAVKRTGRKNPDWVGLNSMQVLDSNTLLLSAGKLSSVFKISAAGSLMTKIDYILADRALYKPYKALLKKVLVKSAGEDAEPEETPVVNNILHKPPKKDPFVSQYGQGGLTYKARSEEGQGVVSMLSCNSGTGAKNTGVSNYYSFLVDETAGTYEQRTSKELEKTASDGSILWQKNSFVYCCSDKNAFSESDMDGKLIKKYTTKQRPYRVYKEDFKNFWFY